MRISIILSLIIYFLLAYIPSMQDMLFQIIGWTGSALLIIAYALVSSKKLNPEEITYQLINLGGAICLLVYALYTLAYPFVLVNAIWLLIGVNFIWKKLKKGKQA